MDVGRLQSADLAFREKTHACNEFHSLHALDAKVRSNRIVPDVRSLTVYLLDATV